MKWRWLATILGFFGVVAVSDPLGATFNWAVIPLLCSALLFAAQDILNRKYAHREPMWAMLFYGSPVAALCSSIPAIYLWTPLRPGQWVLVLLLGIGTNLLLFCLMRALRLIEASATAPYRYVEFLFSLITGYFFFGEKIDGPTLLGAAIIIPSTLLIALHESRQGLNNFHSCC
jgi:S-adenosylmethionine uptake transporter